MIVKPLFCSIIIASLFFAGCKKSGSSTPVKTTQADVYVGGFILNSYAVYFKNGVITKVSDSTSYSKIWAIAVQNNDVYTAGSRLAANGKDVAVYWKNKTAVKLTDSSSDAEAYAIAINGNDVYVAGYTTSSTNKRTATCWKNGVAVNLSDGTTDAYCISIAIQGNDINIVGTIGNKAIYWKNNIATTLLHGTTANGAYAIATDNSNVYIAGFTIPYSHGIYWKNENVINLTDSLSSVLYTTITVQNGDVYVGGITAKANSDLDIPTYWKNGTPVFLPVAINSGAFVNGIAVNADDVYVVGNDYNGGTFWKNGVFSRLGVNQDADFTCVTTSSQ